MMRRYLLTVFLSALLLFLVQPLIAKAILPFFGGSASVWAVCLVFFQISLLAGYAYAHVLATRARARVQVIIHGSLLLLSLVWLPIGPHSSSWQPVAHEHPVLDLIRILAGTIAGPFLMLSSTTPLLQRWFAYVFPGRSVYRLYAVSNAGSLIALLSYPFLIEPRLPLDVQSRLWSLLYGGFVLTCMLAGLQFLRAGSELSDETREALVPPPPGARSIILWGMLAALPVAYMLAAATQLSEQVTVLPLLWILPLSLYLLSFILTFDHPRWYDRRIAGPLLLATGFMTLWAFEHQDALGIRVIILAYMGSLFLSCMCCHGELARRKPHPRYLTIFYLAVAGGGALGGASITFAAPLLLPGYGEFQIALIVCAFLAWGCWTLDGFGGANRRVLALGVPSLGVLLVLMHLLLGQVLESHRAWEAVTRNFYGVLRVNSKRNPWGEYRTMVHGRIEHGTQYLTPDLCDRPTTYYTPESGIGLALHWLQDCTPANPGYVKAGIVGLGVGTLTTYFEAPDTVRYYEINPAVVAFAGSFFTNLGRSPAAVDIVLGDARVNLELELARGGSQAYDILVVDAFSSHAVPTHLLTAEAGAVYTRHLKPGGIIALHVTHAHLDLVAVAHGLADALGLGAVLVTSGEAPFSDRYASDWVLITGNRDFLEDDRVQRVGIPLDRERSIRWTDDFASLWPVMRY